MNNASPLSQTGRYIPPTISAALGKIAAHTARRERNRGLFYSTTSNDLISDRLLLPNHVLFGRGKRLRTKIRANKELPLADLDDEPQV